MQPLLFLYIIAAGKQSDEYYGKLIERKEKDYYTLLAK